MGYSKAEIVKFLVEKYEVTASGAYYHFNAWDRWIKNYSAFSNDKTLGAEVYERYRHIFREASFELLQCKDHNSRVGLFRVMLEANKGMVSFYSSERVVDDRPIQVSWDLDKYKISNNVLDSDKPLRDYKEVQRNES
jgi:hypothetical protein